MAMFASASASIFGIDDQIVEYGTPAELRAVGAVTVANGRHATGFLVSECEVLTVKHAAGPVQSALGRRLRFRQAHEGGLSSRGRVIAEGDPDLSTNWWGGDRRGDWLLLRLDQCLGKDLGYVHLGTRADYWSNHFWDRSSSLQSAGLPGPVWRRGLTRDPNCRIRAERDGMLLHDCASEPGNSGGPLFAVSDKDAGGQVTVFAMHAAAIVGAGPQPWQVERANVAVPVDDVAQKIAPFLSSAPVRASGTKRVERVTARSVQKR